MQFNSPIELYNWMHKNISYKHTGKFLSVDEVMKNKYGDCHDQSNFAYHYLTKMGLKCSRLFMVEYKSWNSPGGATHTLVYFIQNNKYYWFENAWNNQSGIHKPFNTLQELKDNIASKWEYSGKNDKLYMSEYKSVKSGSSLNEYVIANTPENNPKKYYSRYTEETIMNSKALEAFLIHIDENTSIAEEGLGTELLKLAGKGALQILKKLAIFIGINIGIVGLLVYTSDKQQKETKRRFDNPTPEEKLSRDNYINTWRPEIKKFKDMINKDIKDADKKLDIAKFIYITNMSNNSKDFLITMDGVPQNYKYSTYLCGLEWSKCQYPDADGDDEGDPELVKEFSEKIVKMKPYFDKWKREAKKFSPYFELELVIDEPDENYYFCDFSVFLNCKLIDKYGILKPGLPEFKK